MTADDVARDLCGIIDDVPVVFTFGGVEYTGTRGGLINRKSMLEGGVFEAPELSLTTCLKKVNSSGALVNRFPTDGEPDVTNVILNVGGIAARDYRVVRTHRDEWDMGLQMDLETWKK